VTTPNPNDQLPTRETREQIGLRLSFLSTADLRRYLNRSRDPEERAVAEQLLARRGTSVTERSAAATHVPARVVVTDVDMPFWSMVGFMVKWAIASIPAAVILTLLGFVLIALVNGLGELARR